MSDILTDYSRYCGIEVPKELPEFPSTFTVLPEGEYITICTGACRGSGVYDYYNKVLSLIKSKYKIAQIGAPEDYFIFGAVDYRGKLNLRQEAFVIENSSLHIGNDHVFNHIASSKGRPIVGLYSAFPAACSAPKSKYGVFLEPSRKAKPSYMENENPKTINSILPEVVAENIHKIISGDLQKIKTVKIGSKYNDEEIHLLPDFAIPLETFKNRRIICRYDLCPNKEGLIHFLQAYGGPIFTKDPIDHAILTQLSAKIKHIIYYLDDNYSKEFVNFMHYSGIPYDLVTKKTDKPLQDLKLDLFEYNQIKSPSAPDLSGILPDMKFETKQTFFSRGKFYPTAWHVSEDITVDKCDYLLSGLSSKKFTDSWENFYIYQNGN